MTSPIPFLSRFGLVATTVTMAAALVATGIAGYTGARGAAAALVQSRSVDLSFAVRRALHQAGAVDDAALAEVVAELAELDVRYLALLDHRGEVVAAAGEAARPWRGGRGPAHFAPGVQVEWSWEGDRVRLIAQSGPPPGRGMPGRGPPPMQQRHTGPGPAFVVEYEPRPALQLVARSVVTLVLVCAAAALLLAVALVSHRQAREAARLTEALARDQQLKSLGQMSAVLSHELRNPLAALKGHAQLLVEKLAPDQPGRAGAERVVEGAKRLEAIANQILDFARPGAIARRPESPAAVAQAAIELVGDPRTKLSAEGAPERWSLDRLRVEQLLVNLVRNAVEASPDGAPIEVAVRRDGADLAFSVRDHGPGLPPGEEARIFEPFFGRRVRGTGLGLAIARQIAEAHGGRIEGATHPEGGALFRVWIPPGEAAA